MLNIAVCGVMPWLRCAAHGSLHKPKASGKPCQIAHWYFWGELSSDVVRNALCSFLVFGQCLVYNKYCILSASIKLNQTLKQKNGFFIHFSGGPLKHMRLCCACCSTVELHLCSAVEPEVKALGTLQCCTVGEFLQLHVKKFKLGMLLGILWSFQVSFLKWLLFRAGRYGS